MKNKILTFGLILLFIVNISALVTFAYNRWVKPQSKFHSPNSVESAPLMPRQLSLSHEQLKCFRDIRSSYDAEIKEIQAQIQVKRRTLVGQMKKETPDMTSIDKLIEEISRLQAEMQKRAVLNLFKEKEVLTPEQREKFFRMFEDHVCPQGKKPLRDSLRLEEEACPPGKGPKFRGNEDCFNLY
jgi:Spy/CpxP family protein refolding chaperone